METPREFLMRVCKNDGNSNIDYKFAEYSAETLSLPFEKALNMLNRDIQENIEFFAAFDIEDSNNEMATQAAYNMWIKHFVTR